MTHINFTYTYIVAEQHEHLGSFSIINMNGRIFDPNTASFFSPDPFVVDASSTQAFNRYSYCLNNPLMYTDPSGEWSWLVAGLGFIYGYVSYGLMNGDWGWKALGSGAMTGVMWGLGYTSAVKDAGISALSYAGQSAITSTANMFMPSINVPIGDNFSVNFSMGLGMGPSGMGGGANTSGTYNSGDWSLTAGVGVSSSNTYSLGGGILYDGIGLSYYSTKFGGEHAQTVGTWGLNIKGFSLRLENDLFASGDFDRWRTSAVEIGYGNFVIGTSVYTNAPDGTLDEYTSRFWNRTKDAYADSDVYSSPLYIGLKHKGGVTRMGIDLPVIQDITQNGVHLFLSKSSPLVKTPYGKYSSAYRYSGYYNPFSLFYK